MKPSTQPEPQPKLESESAPVTQAPAITIAAPKAGAGVPDGAAARGRARWLPALLILGVLLGAIVVGLGAMRAGGTALSPDGMDYAQLARNLTAGRSFTTDFVRPLALSVMPAQREFYELLRAPLFPFVGALAFIVGGAKDATLVALSLAFWVASAGALWVLALRLTQGNRAVAGVACALWIFSAPVLTQMLQATPATLSTLLVLLMLLALTPRLEAEAEDAATLASTTASAPVKKPGKVRKRRLDPERALRRRYLWAGALLGLCYLSDYLTFVTALPLALWWGTALSSNLGGSWNRKMLGRLALGFVLVAALWWVRNFRLTGNPFYTLQWFELAMGTTTYPDQALFHDASTSGSLLGLGSSVGELARKFARGLAFYFGQVPLWPHVYALPFVVGALGLPARFENVRRCHVKIATVTALGLTMVALALLGRTDTGALMPLTPLLCLLAGISVQWLFASWQSRFLAQQASAGRNAPLRSGLAQIGRWRVLTGLALAILLVLPLLTLARDLADDRANNRNTPARQKALAAVGEQVPKGRAIVTDAPWEVAWYGNHRALWTPLLPAQMAGVQARVPISLALLSKGTREVSGAGWNRIYKGQDELPNFVKIGSSKSGDVILAKEPTLAEARATAKSRPKDPAALVSLAKAQLQAGQARPALQSFRAAAALAPRAPEVFQGIGAASVALNDKAGAQTAFTKVLQLSPRALLAQMGLADVKMAQGQSAAAAKIYEQVLADYPDYPLAINNLAYLYSQNGGNLDLAMQMARRAAQAYPNNPEVLDTLSWVCFRTGRLPEAVAYARRAAQLKPKGALIQYHLAKALLATNQPQDGTNALQNALTLGLPAAENSDARRVLANR